MPAQIINDLAVDLGAHLALVAYQAPVMMRVGAIVAASIAGRDRVDEYLSEDRWGSKVEIIGGEGRRSLDSMCPGFRESESAHEPRSSRKEPGTGRVDQLQNTELPAIDDSCVIENVANPEDVNTKNAKAAEKGQISTSVRFSDLLGLVFYHEATGIVYSV
jgi:hypothetical protein